MGCMAFTIPLSTSCKKRSLVLDDLGKSCDNSGFTLGTQRFGQFSGVWYLASKSFIFDSITFFVQASLARAASFSEILGPQTSESSKTDRKNGSWCPWCRVLSSTMSVWSNSEELLSARGTEASSVLAFLDVFGFEALSVRLPMTSWNRAFISSTEETISLRPRWSFSSSVSISTLSSLLASGDDSVFSWELSFEEELPWTVISSLLRVWIWLMFRNT